MVNHCDVLRAEIDSFYGAVGDLGAPVLSCPGWRVGDLVHHLGTVHRRFRRVAEEGWLTRPPDTDPDERPNPGDSRVVGWAAAESRRLAAALAVLEPTAPRWNFSSGPQTGAFIPRRMLHETAIHRWDAQDAAGKPGSFGTDAAVDGALEYLEVFVPRAGAWHGRTATVRITVPNVVAVDLHLPSHGTASVCAATTNPAQATLTGAAEPLFLALWGRVPIDSLEVSGDERLLGRMRDFTRR
jgi:uncharacterized protein (TIGR03083 family)